MNDESELASLWSLRAQRDRCGQLGTETESTEPTILHSTATNCRFRQFCRSWFSVRRVPASTSRPRLVAPLVPRRPRRSDLESAVARIPCPGRAVSPGLVG